jgi:hypothetical protein
MSAVSSSSNYQMSAVCAAITLAKIILARPAAGLASSLQLYNAECVAMHSSCYAAQQGRSGGITGTCLAPPGTILSSRAVNVQLHNHLRIHSAPFP